MNRYGCTEAQFAELSAVANEMLRGGSAAGQTPIRAFSHQRAHARERGVEWNISLWDWWQVWVESGHWNHRGKGGDCYVMSRIGDVGAYEVGNVFVDTSRRNSALTPVKVSGLPIGVWRDRKRFRAVKSVAGKRHRIGLFDTPEEASAAYQRFGA